MSKQLKSARITIASDARDWPTVEPAVEAAVAEFGGITLDQDYTGRQWALVDANVRMTDDVGWNKEPTTGIASGEKVAGTAGQILVFGDLVYFKSDGKWWKTDADAVATAGPVRVAMSCGPYAADAAGVFLLRGFAELSTWSGTVGAPLYVSGTAGQFTLTAPSTSGQTVRVVAYCHDETTIYFCPDSLWVELV